MILVYSSCLIAFPGVKAKRQKRNYSDKVLAGVKEIPLLTPLRTSEAITSPENRALMKPVTPELLKRC